LKYTLSTLIVFVCLGAALAQEPVNHSVSQPAVSQRSVSQPSLTQRSAALYPIPQPVAYLSQPLLIRPLIQPAAIPRELPDVIPAQVAKTPQPRACGAVLQK
jgi:hypothetical protein